MLATHRLLLFQLSLDEAAASSDRPLASGLGSEGKQATPTATAVKPIRPVHMHPSALDVPCRAPDVRGVATVLLLIEAKGVRENGCTPLTVN